MSKATNALEPLLSIAQTAEVLNVSPKTVHRIIDGGKLPFIRMGKVIRIRPDDLRAYVARCRIG